MGANPGPSFVRTAPTREAPIKSRLDKEVGDLGLRQVGPMKEVETLASGKSSHCPRTRHLGTGTGPIRR